MKGFGREGLGAINTTTVPGVLRGFRHFRLSVAPPDGTLLSLNNRIPYSTGFQRAECTRKKPPSWASTTGEFVQQSRHNAPVRDCTCGIYGWYSPRTIDQGFGEGKDRCTAVIEARGRVVLGTRGFRAQEARVVAIALPERLPYIRDWDEQVDLLKSYDRALERYDAKPFRSLGEMVRAYPPEDVSELVPKQPEIKRWLDPDKLAGMPTGIQQVSASMQQFRAQLLRAAAAAADVQVHHREHLPAPGCNAWVGSVQEFEQLIASGALPRELRVEPHPIDMLARDPHSTVPNLHAKEVTKAAIDLSMISPRDVLDIINRAGDGRYKGVTCVVQTTRWDHGALMEVGQAVERMVMRHNFPCGVTLEHRPGQPTRMEFQLP